MRLEAKPLECSACGEVIEGDPYESEGDPFCTRECSDAFDERVTESMKRRSVELQAILEDIRTIDLALAYNRKGQA